MASGLRDQFSDGGVNTRSGKATRKRSTITALRKLAGRLVVVEAGVGVGGTAWTELTAFFFF